MTQVSRVTFDIPLCNLRQGRETTLSIALRIAAVALGIVAILAGLLLIVHQAGLPSLNTTLGWTTFSVGILTTFTGSTVKQLHKSRPLPVPVPVPVPPSPLVGGASWASSHTHSEVQQTTPFPKLANVGNSCYMNAVLQTLRPHQDYIASVLENLRPLQDGASEKEKNTFRFITALLKALETSTPDSLRALRAEVFKANVLTWGINAQQDAHELLVFLLDQVNWPLFKTFTQLSYTPPGKTTEQTIPTETASANHLSIPINGNNFNALLNGYFETERVIDPSNAYAYEPAGSTRINLHPYKKAERIVTPPELLIVHLMRFHGNNTKITIPIDFPPDHQVTLQQYPSDEPTAYEIVSYINHHSQSLASGHYTAHVKDQSSGKWFHCDDDRIKEANPPSSSSEAYILFLRRLPKEA